MTYSDNHRDDYVNQGQQDDFFDQDLAVAGHESTANTPQEDQALQNQGQQDDYFDQDLSQSDRTQT